MILLTCCDHDGIWHCADPEHDTPCAPHGAGLSRNEAVADFLSQLSNDQLDSLHWDAMGGLNAAWMELIKAELSTRPRPNLEDPDA